MKKNSGIVLNSLTVSVMSIINGAIMASMMTAGKSFGSRTGAISVIAKAPENNAGFNDIPVVGLTDQGINQTFIFTEGQRSSGCIIFSEVECTFRDGILVILPIFCNVRYDDNAVWTVQWAQVGIDEDFYRVSFDENGNIVSDVVVSENSVISSGVVAEKQHHKGASVSIT